MGAGRAGARYAAVDWLRLVAFAAVVIIHSGSQIPSDTFGRVFLLDATRFAVPCFFVLSGFFAAPTSPWWSAPNKLMQRLWLPFLLWFLIYNGQGLFAEAQSIENPLAFANRLIYLFWTGGHGWQLWFVPALVIGMYLVHGSYAALGRIGTAVLVLALFAVGLALGPYAGVLFDRKFDLSYARNGVFLAPILIFSGMVLRSYQSRLQGLLVWSAGVAVLGFALHYAEARLVYGMDVTGADFYAGTLPWAVGLCALCLGIQRQSSPLVSELALATFGAYLVHLFVLRLFWGLFGHDHALAQIVVTIIVSLAVTLLYRRAVAQLKLWRRSRQQQAAPAP